MIVPTFGSIFTALLAGLGVTVLMTAVSFILGTVFAIPIALMRTSKLWIIRWPATAFVDISRSIPPLVWLLIIYYGLSSVIVLDPLPAAIVGLTIISAGYLAENFRAGIDNVAVGQKEAAAALGLTGQHTFWRVVAPQAVNLAVPPSTSYAVMLLKDTAIASIIGVTDIVFLAGLEVSRGATAVVAFSIASLLYLAVGVPLSLFSRYIDGVVRAKVVSV